MQNVLDILRAAYASPYAAAREHRARGGKVVGYFLNSVPEELIVAAGCFPVRLRGEPTHRSPLSERYMEDYMDGEVRASFAALLEGQFDFLDLLVIPRNSEVYLQLYYFLLEMPNWEPAARIPPLHLFDLLQTPSATTHQYVVGRLRAFADRLTSIGGTAVTATSLAQAISTVNVQRRLLQQASRLWQGSPPAISGADALALISSAAFMRFDDYARCLSDLLADPPPALEARPRILIKGSPQSDARFTSLVEQLGGSVVAHDHLWGDRTYATTVDERCEPWSALARHYCFEIPSPREYPQAKADERFVQLVKRAHVEGVIFYHDEWDDTLGWEYPDQKQLLDALGVPSLFLKRQHYFDPDEAAQSAALRAFLATIEHGAPATSRS